MPSAAHSTATIRKLRIAAILAFSLGAAWSAGAADPPSDLVRRVAEREAVNEEARGHYTYRQTVVIQELDERGALRGEFRETREVIFTPAGERLERLVRKPSNTLVRLKLTEEDFRDIRDVQPFLLTPSLAGLYESWFRGEETMDEVDCWVLQVRPRQILYNQRLFDGLFWIDKSDYSIVRAEGRAVPQTRSKTGQENLFPHFTTLRAKVGENRFPVQTHGDDTLHFRIGPQRMRLIIRYADYQRFQADSKLVR